MTRVPAELAVIRDWRVETPTSVHSQVRTRTCLAHANPRQVRQIPCQNEPYIIGDKADLDRNDELRDVSVSPFEV